MHKLGSSHFPIYGIFEEHFHIFSAFVFLYLDRAGGQIWTMVSFFLYRSETVQPMLTKMCVFNHN